MIRTNLGRIFFFVLLWALQVLVFRHMTLGWAGTTYVQIFIYPLFVLSLPIRMRSEFVMLLGFGLGLAVDFVYLSPGVHAGALVALTFFRGYVLNFIEPRTGYATNDYPVLADQGMGFMATYYATALIIHSFWFFMLDMFSFGAFFELWIKTIFSAAFSWFLLLIIQFLFFYRR
jgi:hypothetical protein